MPMSRIEQKGEKIEYQYKTVKMLEIWVFTVICLRDIFLAKTV